MKSFRHAIVIGGSSGIGAELARQLAHSGCKVAIVARRSDRLQQVAEPFGELMLCRAHDVTDYDSIPELFQEITGALGGLDLVIYASGVMPSVGPQEYEFSKDREMVEVNLLGAIAWLDQASIRFGLTGRGTIIGIGSVAGDRGRSGQPVYNTTKAALATYLEALRNRLSQRNVNVLTVKSGPVQTEMTVHLRLKGAMKPEEAARLILMKAHRNAEIYLKFSHRVIFYIIKRIPSPIFRRLKL